MTCYQVWKLPLTSAGDLEAKFQGQREQAAWLYSTTMASTSRDAAFHQNPVNEDDPMVGVAEEEEDEEDQPGRALSEDSSEEEEEDEEEERRIREGFIVDEDEDDEVEEEDAGDRKRRRKRRKRRHRRGTPSFKFLLRDIL